MAELHADVVVLGAGMVGVSAALHLQARGRDAVLFDKHGEAGEETSYGNAGLIERASVFPYMFPRDLPHILRYAFNRSTEAHYHLDALPDEIGFDNQRLILSRLPRVPSAPEAP